MPCHHVETSNTASKLLRGLCWRTGGHNRVSSARGFIFTDRLFPGRSDAFKTRSFQAVALAFAQESLSVFVIESSWHSQACQVDSSVAAYTASAAALHIGSSRISARDLLSAVMARNAPRQPGPPSGVIFGCNRSSEEESLNGLFGMSSGHWNLVKEIIPGTPCFLFNFNTKVRFLIDTLCYGCQPCSEPRLLKPIMQLSSRTYQGSADAPVQICNGKLCQFSSFWPVLKCLYIAVMAGAAWRLQSCFCWWLEH